MLPADYYFVGPSSSCICVPGFWRHHSFLCNLVNNLSCKLIIFLFAQIRLAEAQLQKVSPEDMKPEQLEKVKKLEGWHEELKLLENGNTAGLSAS